MEEVAALRDDLNGQRLGVAISGGGSLGSFEAGALTFCYEHIRISPAIVAGNSAGALNAAKLAHGTGPDGETGAAGVERLWRSMQSNMDMWEPEPWLERILASAQWASAIRESASTTSSGANAIRMAVRVADSFLRRPEETDGTVDAIKDAMAAQSLLSLAPVQALIERELDERRLRASGIALRMGVVSLESGRLRYVTETGALHDREDRPTDHAPISLADGILASASIPVAFPPVLLGDEHYVDGGAREILPLDVVLHHHGVDRAIAISAGAPELPPAPSFADRGLVDILRRVTAEIGPNETLRKELGPPRGWGNAVRLVIPDLNVHDAMVIDPNLIAVSIDYGFMRAADQLLGLDADASALTTGIARTRIALRALAGPLPSLFGRTAHVEAPEGFTSEDPQELTAHLARLVAKRRDLGLPLPATLTTWADGPI